MTKKAARSVVHYTNHQCRVLDPDAKYRQGQTTGHETDNDPWPAWAGCRRGGRLFALDSAAVTCGACRNNIARERQRYSNDDLARAAWSRCCRFAGVPYPGGPAAAIEVARRQRAARVAGLALVPLFCTHGNTVLQEFDRALEKLDPVDRQLGLSLLADMRELAEQCDRADRLRDAIKAKAEALAAMVRHGGLTLVPGLAEHHVEVN